MKILLTGASFLPSSGGIAVAVPRLAAALAGEGATVALWAPDGSAVSSPPLSQDKQLLRLGGTLSSVIRHLGRPDVLHDNGIWLHHNHKLAKLAAKISLPRIVSPRGMLEPRAVSHKFFKKKLAWTLYQRRDLSRAAYHHTTAQTEASHVSAYSLGVPIQTIPNGVEIPALEGSDEHRGKDRRALYLGRLHPLKGLPMLIEAWASVRPKGWRLIIAGPDQGGHRSKLEKLVGDHRLGDGVTFVGPVAGAEKAALYRSADLFILPTYTENFGNVIAEAMAYGVPVLTTRGAPWPILCKQECGWWVEISVEGIANGLRDAVSRDMGELAKMGNRGREIVSQEFSWPGIARRMLDLYRAAGVPSP